MRTLYELTEDFKQLLAMAEDENEDIEVILSTIEGVDYEIELKAEGYAKVIKELEARAEAIKKEEDRLTGMRETIANNIKRMKVTLQQSMEVTGKTKFKPDKYLIPQPAEVDNAAIKELLKNGKVLDFAHLNATKSLRIR